MYSSIFVYHLVLIEHFLLKGPSFWFVLLFFKPVSLLFLVIWSQLLKKLRETADAQTVSHCAVVAMVGYEQAHHLLTQNERCWSSYRWILGAQLISH